MASLMLVNPRRRKKATRSTTRRRRKTTARKSPARRTYRRNPIRATRRRSTRRYRRNPIKAKGLLAPLMPAAVSATGAIGLDLAWGMIGSKLPMGMGTGPMKYVAKAAGALALGSLAAMVTKKDTANQMAVGALTVVLHGAMKDTIQKTLPNVQLGEADFSYMDGIGEYMSLNGMGEYMSEDMAGIGYSGGGEFFAEDDMTEMDGLGVYSDSDSFSL